MEQQIKWSNIKPNMYCYNADQDLQPQHRETVSFN